MDVRNPEHADLLDWKALKSQCDFIASRQAENAAATRTALLAAIKEANAKAARGPRNC